MKIILSILFIAQSFAQNMTCDKESLRREIKRLVQYDNISLIEIQKINNCYRKLYGVSISKSDNADDAFSEIKKKINNSSFSKNTIKASKKKPISKSKSKNSTKSIVKNPKRTFIETLEDSLVKIQEEINFLLYEYDRIIDLSRNILKSNLDNSGMWPFIYINPKAKFVFYRFEGDDLVSSGKSSFDHVIAVYTDRITRPDGKQLIYAEERDLYSLPALIREGFIDYKQVRPSLPKKFVSNIESISFRDHDKNKELIEKSITGVNSMELERWIDVTGYLIDEEVKKKADKKVSQKRRSNLLNFVVVTLFALSLNQ